MVAQWPDCDIAIDFLPWQGERNELVTGHMSTRFSTTRKLAPWSKGVSVLRRHPPSHSMGRAAAWITFMLATATAMAARGGGAYLPITGPTPLRFEVAMARTFALPPVKSAGHLAKTDDAKPGIEPAQALTNAVPKALTVSSAEPDMGAAPATPQTFSLGESMSPVPTAAYSPAGDTPLITPQIMAEYFKPTPGSTNAAGVSVFPPIPVGFTPPMEKTPASSRATYKVQ
jgi:hypothetical protein